MLLVIISGLRASKRQPAQVGDAAAAAAAALLHNAPGRNAPTDGVGAAQSTLISSALLKAFSVNDPERQLPLLALV